MTRLTRRDLFATVLTAANIGIYVTYRQDIGSGIISGTRATAAAVLVVGSAVCVVGRIADLYGKERSDNMMVLAVPVSLLGGGAVVAAVLALTTGSAFALTVQFAASVGLWSTVPLRSLLDGVQPLGRSDATQQAEALPPARPIRQNAVVLLGVGRDEPFRRSAGSGPDDPASHQE